MKTSLSAPRSFEFSFPQRDTLLQVEETHDRVVIRATRASFSDEQKRAFVRELASEGFIADSYTWPPLGLGPADKSIEWLVDCSWLQLSPEVLAISRRFMIRLFIGAGTLWIGLMAFLALRAGA